ncbi:hypothetical protein [Psychroserpens mesophilus]|uniref:hypothetical protein n=1 Tax=Psychroserpens mesophilus TaxID=325473 RepID=UPI00058F0C9E|nr:hypothetical protein [Psychroserpens mesophilus]
MSIIDSPIYNKLLFKKTITLGNLYFFETYLIAEFNEGVIINFDNFNEAQLAIKEHYNNAAFGFISNRIHSYSIVITDAPKFNTTFNNLKAYATVTYSSFASKVFEMENHFFEFNRKNFDDLSNAIIWVEESLKGITTSS